MILESTLATDAVAKLKELMEGRHGPEYMVMEIACEQLEYFKARSMQLEAAVRSARQTLINGDAFDVELERIDSVLVGAK